jgi:hypothetical protein|tara:strand:- start:9 stop:488 length:480 start_codon:yes stop_codon:yes gene_type:complete
MSILLNLIKNLAIQRGVGSLEKRINQFYSDSDDTNQFTSNQRDMGLKSILGRTAAFGLLGPILGPLAFAVGRGIMSRRNQMNLTDDDIKKVDKIITGGGDPNQIQGPTTSQGQAIDPADLKPVTDDSGQDTGFSEYTDAGTAASYEGSFRYGGIASLYR